MTLKTSIAGLSLLCWGSALAQQVVPVQQDERVVVPARRVERPVRETVPQPPSGIAPERVLLLPATPMKRLDGPGARRFVRVTPEQYAAFAAEYQGVVKLFRPDESDRAVNAALLAELIETAGTALRTNESARVKYYTGISHPLHGVMVQGSSYGNDPSVPPSGVYFHEFFEDRTGRVHTVVGNDVDGTRYVTDVLLYDGRRPYARLAYNRAGEFQHAQMVYYRGDQPYLTCRVSPHAVATMELANPVPTVAPSEK